MHWSSSCVILGRAVNSRIASLSLQYTSALQAYLDSEQEVLLQQAYELGRIAIAGRLGLLDIAQIHQRALLVCLMPACSMEEKQRILQASETFFLEALSPFEATHRGFRNANLRLQQLNETLECRGAELTAINYDLHELSNRILHVQEDERKRLSRELHDQVGQALTVLKWNLGLLQRSGEVDATLLKQKLADSQTLLEETMDLVHRFAIELRPAMLDELGLLPALRSYLKALAQRTLLRVRFHGSAAAEQLRSEQKIVLFRVAQESLTNVVKHAQASQVKVALHTLKHVVQMQITDNGQGFPVDTKAPGHRRKRLGLLGMQERVRLVNGQFAVTSAPGQGTTVCVEIPFRGLDRRFKRDDED